MKSRKAKQMPSVMYVIYGAERLSLCPSDFSTYEDVLVHLNINPETVLLFMDGRPVPRDAHPMAGQLRIVSVVSGG